jgi:hypothetical protein
MWEKISRRESAYKLGFRHIFFITKKMLDITCKLAYFSDKEISGIVTYVSTSFHQPEDKMTRQTRMKRFRAVIVTIALAAFTNLAISYAGDALSTKKSGSSILPSGPRPKSGSSILPSGPRPKSGSSILPSGPRP